MEQRIIRTKYRDVRISEPGAEFQTDNYLVWAQMKSYLDNATIEYLQKLVNCHDTDVLVLKANSLEQISPWIDQFYKTILNLEQLNSIGAIDPFFKIINNKLANGGVFVGLLEEKCYGFFCRLKEQLRKKTHTFSRMLFAGPKFVVAEEILTNQKKQCHLRNISKAEAFGRLYSSGFKLKDERLVSNRLVFVAQKVSKPKEQIRPTKGAIVALDRVGKNGKLIKVYKFRTMHPYSEFIQDYVYSKNGSSNGDKANNDFRVTRIGAFLRKYWIDEWPMLINLLRGDVKLVGVRPISESKFNMYPKWLQEKRTKTKPGLVPPFYADMPDTFEGLMESENQYVEKYLKAPLITDIRYFFKALYNIVVKKARSK